MRVSRKVASIVASLSVAFGCNGGGPTHPLVGSSQARENQPR